MNQKKNKDDYDDRSPFAKRQALIKVTTVIALITMVATTAITMGLGGI